MRYDPEGAEPGQHRAERRLREGDLPLAGRARASRGREKVPPISMNNDIFVTDVILRSPFIRQLTDAHRQHTTMPACSPLLIADTLIVQSLLQVRH